MPDARQLPHVLRLLDDPSPTVQRAVTAALLDWGDQLDDALTELEADATTRASVDALLAGKDGDRGDDRDGETTEVTAVVHFDEDDRLSAEIVEDHRDEQAGGTDAGRAADAETADAAARDATRAPGDATGPDAGSAPRGRRTRRDAYFAPGQLVRHRRYGYRGVVVAVDATCRAEDSWYRANRTQPDKDQPWYHVLVDDSDQITYAAQSSLLPDESLRAVDHPLVRYFFAGFHDGHYERNDQPWPE